MLKMDYFNPVVENWTPECMEEELRQRENCHFCLYVITPKMTGVYSVAEVVDDSNKRPEKTILCILEKDDDVGWDEGPFKSLGALAGMVRRNGAEVFLDLESVANYLNNQEVE